MIEDETVEFWLRFDHADLAARCAALHSQRRELSESLAVRSIEVARKAVGEIFLTGSGIEVGAGTRPFPLPEGCSCDYGDIRNSAEVAEYFSSDQAPQSSRIDAQTLEGIDHGVLDFVISAHVIEHLENPIGAIRETILRLRLGGIFICVVPDKTKTWDIRRPTTELSHLIRDDQDGGKSTRLEAYLEHIRFVHPELTGETIQESEVERRATEKMNKNMDIHFHAWSGSDFRLILDDIGNDIGFDTLCQISVENENIFVLKRVLAS